MYHLEVTMPRKERKNNSCACSSTYSFHSLFIFVSRSPSPVNIVRFCDYVHCIVVTSIWCWYWCVCMCMCEYQCVRLPVAYPSILVSKRLRNSRNSTTRMFHWFLWVQPFHSSSIFDRSETISYRNSQSLCENSRRMSTFFLVIHPLCELNTWMMQSHCDYFDLIEF